MVARNFQLIEIIKSVGAKDAGTRIYIGDQPQLRTIENRAVQVTAITAYPIGAVPVALSGNVNAPLADFVNTFLTINVASIDKYLNIPFVELNPVLPNPDSFSPAIQDYFTLNKTLNIDWTKSYIQFAAATSAPVCSFLIGVRYYVLPADLIPVPGQIQPL